MTSSDLKTAPAVAPDFRFTGHETFPCRYAWLPKAAENLRQNPDLFADENGAMVTLGVGKNMVRAIRFWVDATGVAEPKPGGGLEITALGSDILGHDGFDPYLEDIRTLWLLHWKLSTSVQQPLFGWHYMLNYWHRPDFTRTEVLHALQREVERLGRRISAVTLDHHFTTFLHTYLPTRGGKGVVLEENLDCPLTELAFVQKVGERTTADSNRREPIYAFRVEDKPEISPELFVFCLNDFWSGRHRTEQTLPFREVAVGEAGPGQVFKLPEAAIRDRLETIGQTSDGLFDYQESSALAQVVRLKNPSASRLLRRVYEA
ncbi:MAG: DUF4007 family protein [Verrucomicrobiales bacterium]|nr:DUF4007 family protein [Verrucomicrobiales bacterium]